MFTSKAGKLNNWVKAIHAHRLNCRRRPDDKEIATLDNERQVAQQLQQLS
jgi:hypothetical protein